MKTTKYLNHDCVSLKNESLELLITQSVGPRIISLRFQGGENLFAELPDLVFDSFEDEIYYIYGGHRLWHAPEAMPRTYYADNQPVDISSTQDGLLIRQPVEIQTGIEKSIQISLVENKPQVILHHTLINRGVWPIQCAPWAITQLKKGGVAILPQSIEQTGFLPNRSIAVWPYTDINSPHIQWGNRYILIPTKMKSPFKIGFPNPHGWLAYWNEGTLFVKRSAYHPQAEYYDFGSSSECYSNGNFLELETLAPISTLDPDHSVTHIETWEIYGEVNFPENEDAAQAIIEELELE
ncbi:MAG: hypothetical protein WBB69_14145 [Anaerolineales bacterium]